MQRPRGAGSTSFALVGFSRSPLAFCVMAFLSVLLVLSAERRAEAVGVSFPPPLPELAPPDAAQAELGRRLFFDRRLSGDGTMSCAVCHIPQEAYADGQALSVGYPTNKHWRNTQSLINTGYLSSFFWDGRSETLEEQALEPIHAVFEMNLDPDYLVARLEEDPQYLAHFQDVFASAPTRRTIAAALAAFERTLTVNDSPFDLFLTGEKTALSPQALRGAEIFFGERAGCARCHSGPLLSDGKFHNLGVGETDELLRDPQRRATRNFFLRRMGVEPMNRDPGRYAVTREPSDLGAFRTPPLRQVAQTAPYMHNGSLEKLEEVIAFFDGGGGDDPSKSSQLRPLNLSAAEKEELLAFLRSLSGTVPVVRPPLP
jgi:cytochrome c peroxidase